MRTVWFERSGHRKPTFNRVRRSWTAKGGDGPPGNPRKPPGLHLAVFGDADHCLVTILERDAKGEGITLCIAEIRLLAQIAAEPGMRAIGRR